MEGKRNRPTAAEERLKHQPGHEKRPYQRPRITTFGRRLPAFAPPSWPERQQPGRPPSS
jgi:hypothetical protein